MTGKLKTILLVDDDPDMNMVNSYMIKRENFADNVEIALDGEEALKYLETHQPPDLILLDLNMPRINGWEFLDKYHEKYKTQMNAVIIIMVTVSLNPDDKKKAEEEGVYFINKPISTQYLKDFINSHWNVTKE